MSNDRELLEMAAKAAGYVIRWYEDSLTYGPTFGIEVEPGNPCGFDPWKPLTDDGDALRLAVKLRISIDHNHPADQSPWVSATADGGRAEKVEEFEDERDRCTATRMAIVRAAAEIGRRMP